MHAQQFLVVEKRGEATEARFLHQVLDGETARFACDQLSRLIQDTVRPRLRLDLAGVHFLTAAGLGRLVGLNSQVRNVSGKLTLRNVRGPVYEVLQATRLTEVLDVMVAEGEAVALPA